MRSLVVRLERPSSRTAHSTVTEPKAGSISPLKLTEQRPTTYSSRRTPQLRQEGIASLLQVGEDDGVVDVAEPVEVAPAHLHPVPGGVAHAASSSGAPSASRSAGVRRTRSSA